MTTTTNIAALDRVLLDADGHASHATAACPAARLPLAEVVPAAGGFYCGTCIDVDPDLRPRVHVVEPERGHGDGTGRGARPARTVPAATDAQLRFLRKLAAERGRDLDALDALIAAGMTVRMASALIDDLKAAPAATPAPGPSPSAPPAVDLSAIPEGRYLIAGVVFKVDTPDNGEWAGWTFVKAGADRGAPKAATRRPDGRTTIRSHADLLALVAGNPAEYATAYGREFGTCGVCGRELTDPDSITRGIGPVCAGRYGY